MVLPVPTPITYSVAAVLTAAQLNTNLRDGVQFLLTPPVFKGHQTVGQSIPNVTFTPVSIDTADIDSYSGWSTGTNTRYTAQVNGFYLISGQASFNGNATGQRQLAMFKNGNPLNETIANATVVSGTLTTVLQCTGIIGLNATDYIEVRAYQSSGGALSTAGIGALQCVWVHS